MDPVGVFNGHHEEYLKDSPGASTDTLRNYSRVGLSLYYSGNTTTYGQNTPALAQSPSISQVTSNVNTDSPVTINAHVSGHPSPAIQQACVPYTGEHGPLPGARASLSPPPTAFRSRVLIDFSRSTSLPGSARVTV